MASSTSSNSDLSAPNTHRDTHHESCSYTLSCAPLTQGITWQSHRDTHRSTATRRIEHTNPHAMSRAPQAEGHSPLLGQSGIPAAPPGPLECSPGSTVSQADW